VRRVPYAAPKRIRDILRLIRMRNSSPSIHFMQRLLGLPPEQQTLAYERVLSRLETLEQTLNEMIQRPQPTIALRESKNYDQEFKALRESLEGIEKQLQRNGREQLKSNILVESQQAHMHQTLELLESINAHRDQELNALRQQIIAAQNQARLEIIRELLPALDGIDHALRSGEEILGSSKIPKREMTLFERMRMRDPSSTPEELRLRNALRSWQHGLTHVRERLLSVLASQHVRPIDALHAPFDPNLHVAVQALPATIEHPADTVVAVLQTGYMIDDRVLRHAEVAVAREWNDEEYFAAET